MEIDNFRAFAPPKLYPTRKTLGHTGKILFNLTIAAAIISLILISSPLFYALFVFLLYGLLIISAIFTVGILFMAPWYRKLWGLGVNPDMVMLLSQIGRYIMIGVSVAAFISCVLMFFDNKKPISRIVVSIIVFVLSVLANLLILGVTYA